MKTAMKTLLGLISIVVISSALLMGAATTALACDMSLSADQTVVSAGETVVFTLERYATHRTCSVPLEDTDIAVAGGTLVDPGVWQPGTPDILVFSVKFDDPGTGTVTITRTCDKTPNLTVSATVEVSAAPAVNPDDTVSVQSDPAVAELNATGSSSATAEQDNQSGNRKGNDADKTVDTLLATSNTATLAANPADKTTGSSSTSSNSGVTQTALSDGWLSSWLPSWLLIDSNWAWWAAFIALALGLFLLRLEPFRRPLLIASLVILGFYLGACPCPMGSVFKLFVQTVSVVLLLVLLVSLIWGRFFCGWLCPMGAVQAFFRARGFNWQVPPRADQILKAGKYLVLAGFILATAWTGVNAWIDYDPFKALFNFNWTMPAVIILALVLAGNLFIERFFCRYLCPLGAVLAIINRLRALWGWSAAVNDCTGCQKCVKQGCPTGALQMIGEGKEARAVIDSSECISCRACEKACSKQCIKIQ